MLSHVLLSLMLASLPEPIPVETVQTYDFGKMTFEEAKRLDRKIVRVSFTPFGLNLKPRVNLPIGMPFIATAAAAGEAPALRHIVFSPGGETGANPFEARMTVDGKMWTRCLPPRVIAGKVVDEDRRIELRDAKLVRP